MKLIRYSAHRRMVFGHDRPAHRLRLLKPSLRLPVCYSTFVLSNLGRVTAIVGDRLPRDNDKYVAGNLVLEEITGRSSDAMPHTAFCGGILLQPAIDD